jgi:hypothetical protein
MKDWNLNTIKAICRRFDRTGSAIDRKAGVTKYFFPQNIFSPRKKCFFRG